MKKLLKYKFKCKLCGEIFTTFKSTIYSEKEIDSFILRVKNDIENNVNFNQIHHCRSINGKGISEYVGFTIEEIK